VSDPRPRRAADASRRVVRASRGAARASRGAARASRIAARRVRQATHAQGAGETGLGRLIELHGVSGAGDAMVAISLAGTLFFSVPVGEARGRVALYLLITMAPFALLAPVVGPLLDRLRHGRRYAIATTFGLRAVLALVMAAAAPTNAVELYPAAFGCLVASRAYSVSRAALVPRLLPSGLGLVKANSRISLAGVLAAVAAAPVAGALAYVGPQWSLRACALVFAGGVVLALRLPRRVDSARGEQPIGSVVTSGPVPRGRRRAIGPVVVLGLRSNAALRGLSGLLTTFLAFLLREEPVGGLDAAWAIGLVAAAAALGSTLGTLLGAVLRTRPPEPIIFAVLGLTVAATAWGGLAYGLLTVLVLAGATGVGQSLGRLALDAMIQREVPEAVRTAAFARAETALQLAWVIGGGIGLALPARERLGLGLAAGGLAAVLVHALLLHRRAGAHPAEESDG
jgi:MFS family permease